ncbi:MAG: ABC transporter permease [Anaerolineales bacterium]|nr:ABC transporter permease [Anaerolineales bacterium]
MGQLDQSLDLHQPANLAFDRRRALRRQLSRLILPTVLIVWLVFLSFSSPVFLTANNLFNVTRQVAVIGILALAQLLCLLTGNIDLSIGSYLGLFGALLGGLSLQWGFGPALTVALAVTLAWGLTNGFLVSRGTGISVIITLSTMYVARGITLIYTDGHPFIRFPMPYEFLGAGNVGPVPWSLITLVCVAGLMGFVLRYTAVGRHLYAMGGNREAARVCGIHLTRLTLGVFIGSALLTALASIVLLGRVASAQPNAGVGMELDSIAAVLIGGASVSGGTGGVVGTLIGVFMLGFINNGLNLLGVSGFYQYVFKGLIILLAVMVDTLQRRNS